MRQTALVLGLCGALLAGGCTQQSLDPKNKYPVTGMAIGAAIGASIGGGLGDPFGSALVGAVGGGIAGLIYSEYWKEEIDQAVKDVEEQIDSNF